jgi:bacillolysin
MLKYYRFYLILFLHINLTALSAKSFTGEEANKLLKGAETIRTEAFSEIPVYVQFRKGSEIAYSNFEVWFKRTFKLSTNISFKLLNVEKDKLGMLHYRLQQTYNNFPVTNTMYIVHTKNGNVVSFNGNVYDKITALSSAAINEEIALQRALLHMNADIYRWESEAQENEIKRVTENPAATWFPKGNLVITPIGGKLDKMKLRLAYRFDIYAEKPFKRYYIFVDATNGEIIYEQNRILDANTPATAMTVYSGPRNIITDSNAGGYRLRETGRGLGIETYNLNTTTNYGNAVDFTNSTTTWNNVNASLDQYATDAHWGAEKTYDFYDSTFARNSVDNAGQKLLSYVHYDLDYTNANWDGTHMNYGDGDASAGYTPLTAIDITAHEMSHGVTQFTSDLVYQDEPGALNEGFSDCMGVAVRQFARNAPVMGWLIGDEIGGNPFRNMANPNQYGDPDTYGGTNWHAPGGTDNGGVHQNSGVLNFWFYLLTMGGSGTNDNGEAYNISALGLEKASQILYRSQAIYNGPNSQFADARIHCILSAIDLYGACTNEVIQVTNAWYAVGVGDAFVPGVTAAFTAPTTNFCSVTDSVLFINTSNNAGAFIWDFGDGNTSTDINPVHFYANFGVYTVKLIADAASCGVDSVIQVALININPANPCITVIGTNTVQTSCAGIVYDSGGPTSNYEDNTNYTITIAPLNSSSLNLHFNAFSMENNYDYLMVYDGPSTASPLIGTYTGTTIPANIQSSGNSITLRQTSDNGVTGSGFNIDWTCALVNAPPIVDFSADNTTSCNGTIQFTDNSIGAANSWLWIFGDGNTSTLQNPSHTYATSGIYNVTLKATNIIGTDSLVQNNFITVNLPLAPVPANSSVNIACGDFTTLTANGPSQLQWYDAPVGGILLDTGSTYVTPNINNDETYYVQSKIPAPSNYVGPFDNLIGGGNNYTTNTNRALVFDCLSPLTLVSVKVIASGAGNRTIQLKDNAGTILYSSVINVPNGTSRIYLNYEIPVGTGFELGCLAISNLYRNNTGANYPYTFPGLLTITGNTATSSGSYYYFFYDWEIKGPACVSERASVNVNVNEPVASFTENTIGLTSTFTNNSLNATSYLWNFGDGNTSTLLSPVHSYSFDGFYDVSLYAYAGNCIDTLNQTISIVTTQIQANSDNVISIYPNPSSGAFNLSLETGKLLMVEVTNALGQIVISSFPLTQSVLVNMPSQSKGVYFVRCKTDRGTFVRKIVLH